MHICFAASSFPRGSEAVYTFVKEYVDAIADRGVTCTVISPQSMTRVLLRRARLRPRHWSYLTAGGNRVDVFQPYMITLSNHLEKARTKYLGRVMKKTIRSLHTPIDAFYGHFWKMGILLTQIAEGIPVFLACGESKICIDPFFTEADIEKALQKLSGVVYVSSKSLQESRALELQRTTPYIIAPNGYNPAEFAKRDKAVSRKILGFAEDVFIVAFVGSFIPRKGTLRLAEALDRLNEDPNKQIASMFIGKGKEVPQCKHILFCGTLAHEQICTYLSAADIFVLPTNNEGCCNAIIEALACGLPVVSSDKSFNDDILDDACSIRIDEMDVSQIAAAIERLYMNRELTERMSAKALEKATHLTIGERSQHILQFVRDTISSTDEKSGGKSYDGI